MHDIFDLQQVQQNFGKQLEFQLLKLVQLNLMPVHISGVVECQSKSSTPIKQLNSSSQFVSPLNFSEKMRQAYSTNVSPQQTLAKKQEQSSQQHIESSASFVYPSAFTIGTPLISLQDGNSNSYQSNYWQYQNNVEISSIKKKDQFFGKKQQEVKKKDPFDKIFQQMQELSQNVKHLEKITNKFTKIYNDSTVIIKSSVNSQLQNARIRTFSQNYSPQVKQTEQENMLEQIREKLEKILMAAEEQSSYFQFSSQKCENYRKSISDNFKATQYQHSKNNKQLIKSEQGNDKRHFY